MNSDGILRPDSKSATYPECVVFSAPCFSQSCSHVRLSNTFPFSDQCKLLGQSFWSLSELYVPREKPPTDVKTPSTSHVFMSIRLLVSGCAKKLTASRPIFTDAALLNRQAWTGESMPDDQEKSQTDWWLDDRIWLDLFEPLFNENPELTDRAAKLWHRLLA